MKLATYLSAFVFAAAALPAQQPPIPPVPPVRPEPAPRVRPAPLPALAPLPDVSPAWNLRLDYDLDYNNYNLDSRLNDLQIRSQNIAERATEQASRAMANIDVGRLQDIAGTQAAMALADAQSQLSSANWQMNESYAGSFGSSDERFAHSPRAPWVQGDPADSMYRMAREAFNRGDWRHSADLFNQITVKFPRSAYVSDCAYYEAFARYRIGTTDELHKSLALLTDQSAPTARSSMRADVAGLAARVRGALAARGDQQAAAQVAQEAQKSGGCDREDMSVKAEALNALGQMDPAAATPLLQRVLARKDTCSTDLKRSALFMLVRRGDTVATNALITVATNNDEDPELRSEAISYLGRMPGDAPLAALETLVKSSNDDRIQRAAVRGLSQSDSPRARQGIRALIERSDVSESLRAEAINSLGSDRSTSDDAAYLRGVYPKMPSERLKEAVLRSLARIGGPENEQFLMSVAGNASESSEVRGTAISYAGRLTTVSVADLSKLYDVSDSRNMREQIIGVLGQRKEPAASDKLMDIITNGTDPDTRRVAINVLSRKKDDPRVTKFLLDLVGK
ncbi:MAG TPA: HEAT repeat domain-containing protein [Gemmatimonadaceae bacterium]